MVFNEGTQEFRKMVNDRLAELDRNGIEGEAQSIRVGQVAAVKSVHKFVDRRGSQGATALLDVYFADTSFVRDLGVAERKKLQNDLETAVIRCARESEQDFGAVHYVASNENLALLFGGSSRLWPCSRWYLVTSKRELVHDVMHRWSAEEAVLRYRKLAHQLLLAENPAADDTARLKKLAGVVSKGCAAVHDVSKPEGHEGARPGHITHIVPVVT